MTESAQYRFAAHVLLFDVDTFILPMLENCGPHVEKIYAAYSPLPWTYNSNARRDFKNPTTPDCLKHSPWHKKVHLIEGLWDNEEDQRNACLAQAKADGIDFLIIHDADEYYTHADYRKNLELIAAQPRFDYYKTPWCTFWKNLDYVIQSEIGIVCGYPEFAVNCRKEVLFTRARILSGASFYILPGLCHHLSSVHSDETMYRKISTWGHAHQIDREQWFSNKWQQWHTGKYFLHPVTPSAWIRAVPFRGRLPEVLEGFPQPQCCRYTPTLIEGLKDRLQGKWWLAKKNLSLFLARKKHLINLPQAAFRFGKKIVRIFSRMATTAFEALIRLRLKYALRLKSARLIARYGALKIHLGCGEKNYPDMLNCEYRHTAAADIVMDCGDLSGFAANSAELIYSHAFFEHLYKNQRLRMLKDTRRILKPGGLLIFLGLPDFSIIARSYLGSVPLQPGRDFDLGMVYRYTHGDPEETAPEWWLEQLHKTLFDRPTACALLEQADFDGWALFNYRYPGEDIALNLGWIAWHGTDAPGDVTAILSPFVKEIGNIDDIKNTVTVGMRQKTSAQSDSSSAAIR